MLIICIYLNAVPTSLKNLLNYHYSIETKLDRSSETYFLFASSFVDAETAGTGAVLNSNSYLLKYQTFDFVYVYYTGPTII